MSVYPILDYFGAALLFAIFVLMLVSEHARPLRSRVQHWLKRVVINAIVAVPSFVVLRLLLVPLVVVVATWAEARNFGLTHLLQLPRGVAFAVSLLGLDYAMFGWHWLNHRMPLLWRFHHVHHSDLDLDVSTAFRFHFGEMALSVIVRSLQVALLGASPTAALTYEILLEASTEFHHSNVRLPLPIERVLSWFVMTPRAHGTHHSVVPRETNSNFSNFLILWDRLHGTLHLHVAQEKIVIGVPDYRDPRELTAFSLLAMPFRRRRISAPLTEERKA